MSVYMNATVLVHTFGEYYIKSNLECFIASAMWYASDNVQSANYDKINPDSLIRTPLHRGRVLFHPEVVYFILMTGWLYTILLITWLLTNLRNKWTSNIDFSWNYLITWEERKHWVPVIWETDCSWCPVQCCDYTKTLYGFFFFFL